MPKKVKFKLAKLLLLAVFPWLSGCAQVVLFHPKGEVALEELHLILIATGLMLIVVLPVIVLTLVFAWKYRSTNSKAKYDPEWAHSVKLEIIWWLIPCVIVAILATIAWVTSHTLDPYRELNLKKKPLVIQVVSLDWRWLFIYPQQKVAMINHVAFPINTPIEFQVTSDAPMNSFWIPQLGSQIYSMTGMRSEVHLVANQAGSYDGSSANFSGAGFSKMRFKADALPTEEDFNNFIKEVRTANRTLDFAYYNKNLTPPSQDSKVVYYSGVQKDLFNMIIMKYHNPKVKIQPSTLYNNVEEVN